MKNKIAIGIIILLTLTVSASGGFLAYKWLSKNIKINNKNDNSSTDNSDNSQKENEKEMITISYDLEKPSFPLDNDMLMLENTFYENDGNKVFINANKKVEITTKKGDNFIIDNIENAKSLIYYYISLYSNDIMVLTENGDIYVAEDVDFESDSFSIKSSFKKAESSMSNEIYKRTFNKIYRLENRNFALSNDGKFYYITPTVITYEDNKEIITYDALYFFNTLDEIIYDINRYEIFSLNFSGGYNSSVFYYYNLTTSGKFNLKKSEDLYFSSYINNKILKTNNEEIKGYKVLADRNEDRALYILDENNKLYKLDIYNYITVTTELIAKEVEDLDTIKTITYKVEKGKENEKIKELTFVDLNNKKYTLYDIWIDDTYNILNEEN